MPSQEPFSKHEKLLHYIAHKVHRRLRAAGARSVEINDIFQELAIAWCKARDLWDAAQGVPFGAYLMRGMGNHINRWADYEIRERNMAPFDLDAEIGDEESGTLYDVLADESIPSPEAILIQEDIKDFALNPVRWRARPVGWRKPAELSPKAKKFLELVSDPPDAIMEQFHALQARAKYAREVLKIPSACGPKRVTASLVLDVMGVSDRLERLDIYSQLNHLSDKVSQQ